MINWDDLNEFKKIRIEAIIKKNKDNEEKLKPIYEYYDGKKYRVLDVINIEDEIQLAKVESRHNPDNIEVSYHIFIQFKKTHYGAESLDKALIQALCVKHHQDGAAVYISNMLMIK